MNRLVIPLPRFVEEVRALRRAQGPASFVDPEATFAGRTEGTQILVPPLRAVAAPLNGLSLRLGLSSSLAIESAQPPASGQTRAALILGQGPDLGRVRAWVRRESGVIEAIDELVVPSPPGLMKIRLGPTADAARGGAKSLEIFSRVAGALTEPVFRNLRSCRFALTGAGRLQGALAMILARDGARRFALIDHDIYEVSNGGAGFAGSPTDAGLPKVRVLGRALRAVLPSIEVLEVPHSVTSLAALHAILDSDFVVVAVDHDMATLAAAWLAALFNKLLVVVGAGIFRTAGGRREMGADIRFAGMGRCLMCSGGLRAEAPARETSASAEAEHRLRNTPRDWRIERAGSLASLNAAAAGLAVRLIQDAWEGRIFENAVWLRLSFDEAGGPVITSPPVPPVSHCCCSLAGQGFEGMDAMTRRLRDPHH